MLTKLLIHISVSFLHGARLSFSLAHTILILVSCLRPREFLVLSTHARYSRSYFKSLVCNLRAHTSREHNSLMYEFRDTLVSVTPAPATLLARPNYFLSFARPNHFLSLARPNHFLSLLVRAQSYCAHYCLHTSYPRAGYFRVRTHYNFASYSHARHFPVRYYRARRYVHIVLTIVYI